MNTQTLRNFAGYIQSCWTIADKGGSVGKFRLNPAQLLVDAEINRQMSERGYARVNVLKTRQAGITTYSTALATHYCQTRRNRAALTIAHETQLPQNWLRRARRWRDETPEKIRPSIGATTANELYYDKLGSRYYVGSARGGFPGMGDCIHFLHMSEVGSWDKTPVLIDPDMILADLGPALPSGTMGHDTIIIRESTGKSVGDWWYKAWHSAAKGEDDFFNVFIPWFIMPEYRRDDLAGDILELDAREKEAVLSAAQFGIELDNGQLAWRRLSLRGAPYFGDELLWGSRFPATEEEAFLAPGLAVFTFEQVTSARETIREPEWKGDLLPADNPQEYKLDGNPAGNLWLWENPDPRYHYVIGADCQWGTSEGADYDNAYVECLETGRVCARLRGRFDWGHYGRLLASLGYFFNVAKLAPERNALAATALIPLLRGLVSPWRYPNIWIRSDDIKLKGHRPQDYGWQTDQHSKGEIIAFAKSKSIDRAFDWADSLCVDEMAAWIHDPASGKPTTVEGGHDDCLMSRMITAYVAHRERPKTDLYKGKEEIVYYPRSMQEAFRDMAAKGEPDESEEEYALVGYE